MCECNILSFLYTMLTVISMSYSCILLCQYIQNLHHILKLSCIYLRPCTGTEHGTSTASAYRHDDSLQEQPLLQLPLSSPPITLSPPPPCKSSSSHQLRSRRHCSKSTKDKCIIVSINIYVIVSTYK